MFEERSIIVEGEPVTLNIPKVEDWTISSLRYCCKNNKVKGYTKMSKEQLIEEVLKIIREH
jgi:hypothetical protein